MFEVEIAYRSRNSSLFCCLFSKEHGLFHFDLLRSCLAQQSIKPVSCVAFWRIKILIRLG